MKRSRISVPSAVTPAAGARSVSRSRTLRLGVLAALLVGGALLSLAQGAEPTPQERAQLQKQLDDARGRLDDAARDVAELSAKLYGERSMPMPGFHGGPHPRGAMLGINIGERGKSRDDGVEIVGVSPSGPAEAAGLRAGDVLTAVDGKSLARSGDRGGARVLVEHLRSVEPGQVVKVDYLRDGRKQSASVKSVAAEPPMVRMLRERVPMLEGMELPHEVDVLLGGPGRGMRSLELVPITPKLGRYFGTDKGLLVVRAPAGEGVRLEEGDVILSIGGRTPENTRHAFRILGSYQPSDKVPVEVVRQHKRMTLEVQVPAETDGPALRPRPPHPPTPPASPT